MFDANDIKRKLGDTFTEDQIQTLTEVLREGYVGLATSIDMRDLKDAVKDLAIAQARSEERLDRIEAAIEKLTAAQIRSEKRLDRVEERLDRIEAAIEKLAAAQIRSEKRLNRVEERLDRIEAAIEKLTVAQICSEERLDTLTERLDTLVKEHGKTRTQLGGLAMTVGYTLENAAYRALPALLKADYGIEIQDRLIRTYFTDDKKRSLEVNIFGKGLKNGREVVILGESKSQLSAKHINRFISTRLYHLKPLFGEVLPVLVTHMISSEGVAAYAKEQGIALYYSYQF